MTGKLSLVKSPTHAPLSPSKAHRWLVCPGSQLVSDEDQESVYAAEGTRKHEVLKRIMHGAPVLAGDIIMDRPVEVETIEQCITIREYVEQWRAHHPDWEIRSEVKLEVGSKVWPGVQPGECEGTSDVVAWGWDELLVLDAKFGWVQVEARDNPQLNLYGLGALEESLYPVKSVCLIIAQPGYDGEVVFKEERTTPERLYQWALEVQTAVEEARAGSRRLQAEDHACRYCPARTFCPARLKAVDDFNSDEWIQAHRLEDLLPFIPRLEAIIKDLKSKALANLTQNVPVPGWKLVAGRSKRQWKEEPDKVVPPIQLALLQAKKLAAVHADDYFEKKLKSPAKMEKLLKAHLGTAAAKKVVADLAFTPGGRPKLAPITDERPALESGQFTLEDVLKFSLEEQTDGE